MPRLLTLTGLFLTLVGAGLLFFYGLPKKQIGNVALMGDIAMKWSPDSSKRDVPDPEWQSEFDAFRKRSLFLNRTGFALVAIGTLLQFLAAW